MLTRIRRHLDADEGLTLVELLVALFVIGVALFALLGSFVASAQSVQHQQDRAAATRLATETLEQARAEGFEALEVGDPSEREVVERGRTFTVTRTVEWLDAEDPEAALNEDVKHVVVVVRWETRGNVRTLEFDTVVAPIQGPPQGEDGDADPGFASITMFPNPINVDEDGVPVQDVGVTVRLRHYPPTSSVAVAWEDDDGTKSRTLVYTGLNSWTVTIPRTEIRFVPGDEEEEGDPEEGDPEEGDPEEGDPEEGDPEGLPSLVFTFTASDGAGQVDEDQAALKVQLLIGELPTIASTHVVPAPVTVNDAVDGACGVEGSCMNEEDITLTAVVEHLDGDDIDAVKARWTRWDGGTGEIALRQSDTNELHWEETIPRRSDTFQPGTNTFVFVATRASDRAEGTTSHPVTVVVE